MKWFKQGFYNGKREFSKRDLLDFALENKNYILVAYMIEYFDIPIKSVKAEIPISYFYLSDKIVRYFKENNEEFDLDIKNEGNPRILLEKSFNFLREYCLKQEKSLFLLPLNDVRENIINYITERAK